MSSVSCAGMAGGGVWDVTPRELRRGSMGPKTLLDCMLCYELFVFRYL